MAPSMTSEVLTTFSAFSLLVLEEVSKTEDRRERTPDVRAVERERERDLERERDRDREGEREKYESARDVERPLRRRDRERDGDDEYESE